VGINTLNPLNIVHIQSNVAPGVLNPIASAGPTRSGLKFQNLNSTMVVDALDNTGPGHPIPTVLSVNETGDVILVRGGGSGIGDCNSPTLLSPSNGVIDFNGNNFYFLGANPANGRLGVGLPACTPLTAKFSVNGNAVIGVGYTGAVAPPANGMLVQGFTGIGAGFQNVIGFQPVRQLEVLHATLPQFRLTQSKGLAGQFTTQGLCLELTTMTV
jgi:hypothetical protein